MRPPSLALVCAFLLSSAVSAAAQQADPPFLRYDVTGAVGWFNANADEPGAYDNWYTAASGELAVGRFWTEHLKTEVGVAFTSRGEVFASVPIQRSSVNGFIQRRVAYHTTSISALQIWQFGRNAWVHPFVGAGLDVQQERERTASRETVFRPGFASIESEETVEEDTAWRPRALAAAGVKVYMSRAAFFRTDVRTGFGGGVDEVTWRFGFGADF